MSDEVGIEVDDLVPEAKPSKFKHLTPDTPIECFDFDALGNADRFASRNLDDVLYFSTDKQRVFFSVGEDNRWIRNEGKNAGDVVRRCRSIVDEMKLRAVELLAEAKDLEEKEHPDAEMKFKLAEAMKKWASASANNSVINMASMACLTYNMTTDPDEDFDARPELLATPSQMLELHGDGTITARDIQQGDYVTYSTSVDYDPDILNHEPELITQFRETFVPEKDRWRLIMKALGSAMMGGNQHTLMIVLEGKSGMNGKSQLMEAIRAVLSDYASMGTPSIFRGNFEDKARPDILKTLKKRIVFLAEASKNWELHGDRVKNFTGGDGIPLRRMYSDAYMDVVPQCTPVIYTNAMPRINGADNALKRRILAIEFNRQPKVKDPTIKAKFMASDEVRSYLFAALLQGFTESCQAGIDDVLEEFAMYSKGAFEDVSHLGEFFEWLTDTAQLKVWSPEELAITHGVKSKFVTLKMFHERYMWWIKEHGNKQDGNDKLNFKEFNQALRDMYGWTSIKSGSERWEARSITDLSMFVNS